MPCGFSDRTMLDHRDEGFKETRIHTKQKLSSEAALVMFLGAHHSPIMPLFSALQTDNCRHIRLKGKRYETPTPSISPPGSSGRRPAGPVTNRRGAALSHTACAHHR